MERTGCHESLVFGGLSNNFALHDGDFEAKRRGIKKEEKKGLPSHHRNEREQQATNISLPRPFYSISFAKTFFFLIRRYDTINNPNLSTSCHLHPQH